MTTVEVGAEPEGILVSPDGKTVFVTSEVANMVHVVDPASESIVANIVAGNRPRRFAVPAGGDMLWVTNELSGSVSIIDLGAMEVSATIEFKPKGFRPEDVTPVGITTSADGGTAFVALGRANHVAVVDVASREVEDYILVGKPGLEHHPQPGRVHPVCGQRTERRHLDNRRRGPQGHQVGPGGAGALRGPDRRLRRECRALCE